jgi:hypothetical protein
MGQLVNNLGYALGYTVGMVLTALPLPMQRWIVRMLSH